MSQVQFIHRGSRRYFLNGIPSLPFLALETFESMTLGGTDLANGWQFGGVVFTYAGPVSLETFETSTLTNNTPPGPDYGWMLDGIVQFTTTVTFSAVFTDLGGTVTLTAAVSTVAGTSITSYQWYQNGVAMVNGGAYSGVTTAALVITGTVSGDYTTYTCQVVSLGYTSTSTAVTLIDRATDWSNRVVVNGGAAPAAGTVTAARTFVNSLISNSLLTKMVAINMVAPDSLIAAITPLIKGSGLDPWTNHSFVVGDLTVNGLLGDGSTKWLNTGVVPGSSGMATGSAGLAFYAFSDDHTPTQVEIGTAGATASEFFLFFSNADNTVGGNAHFYCWRTLNLGTDSVGWTVPSPATGFYVGSRTATNAIAAYRGTSGGFTTLASSTNTTASVIETVQPIYAFAYNSNGSGPLNISRKRVSFFAMMKGISSTEASNFFTAVQALRTSFGGGFV